MRQLSQSAKVRVKASILILSSEGSFGMGLARRRLRSCCTLRIHLMYLAISIASWDQETLSNFGVPSKMLPQVQRSRHRLLRCHLQTSSQKSVPSQSPSLPSPDGGIVITRLTSETGAVL